MTLRPALPPLACDTHLHIYRPACPTVAPLPAAAAQGQLEHYQQMQRRLGTTRAVVVAARVHGTDNRPLLQAIAGLGLPRTRGVAVLHPGVAPEELQRLHAGGVRGLRFTLHSTAQAPTTIEMLAPLAQSIAPLGWHVQLHFTAAQILQYRHLLNELPVPVVFDHFARLGPQGPAQPAWEVVASLLQSRRAWVKISGPYLNSAAPGWRDLDATARALLQLAPQRLLWGSDWPHVTEGQPPDTAALLPLLWRWVEEDPLRFEQLLVHNPAQLYGFPSETTPPTETPS